MYSPRSVCMLYISKQKRKRGSHSRAARTKVRKHPVAKIFPPVLVYIYSIA